ncbi:MAG: tetratricopeptide repeat protein [Chloroflexota bacterium]|nr:tetratricopeptide repeat protein [Chloroflexota bacterium]
MQQGVVDLQRSDPVLAQGFLGVQMADLRRAQGRLGELEGAVKSFLALIPLPAYRAVLALVYQEQDRREEARALFDELAKDDFAVFDDGQRPISLALLTDVCCYLDDHPRAAVLYELLLPMADHCVAVAGMSFQGSASAPLGVLATTLGRFDDAERHFEDAIAMNRKMRAPRWVAVTQLSYAQMLLRCAGAGDRERALGMLDEAIAAAEAFGMKALLDQATALRAAAPDADGAGAR